MLSLLPRRPPISPSRPWLWLQAGEIMRRVSMDTRLKAEGQAAWECLGGREQRGPQGRFGKRKRALGLTQRLLPPRPGATKEYAAWMGGRVFSGFCLLFFFYSILYLFLPPFSVGSTFT